MDGIKRIEAAFNAAGAAGRAALMPYLTLGYPDIALSLDVIEAAAQSGADLIELGVPFSDPLADGPTIQRSTQTALQKGMTLARCIEMVKELRQRGIAQPLLMMGYYNPILAYGVQRFVEDAARAGADGFIVPDLPPAEAVELEDACRVYERALVYLASPNTTPQRLAFLAERTSGFLYLVSVTGVTGARSSLPVDLESFVGRARIAAHTPVAVGFGIATPEQAAAVGKLADGVIVGSAVIQAIDKPVGAIQGVKDFVGGLAEALRS